MKVAEASRMSMSDLVGKPSWQDTSSVQFVLPEEPNVRQLRENETHVAIGVTFEHYACSRDALNTT